MSPEGRREIANLEEFHAWVRDFAGLLRGDEILLLSGEMAAGKTEFTKVLGRIWGATEIVSPTFALHNRISAPKGTVDHFDLYRVENSDELETTGLWEIASEKTLLIVEWPERVGSSAWPRSRTRFEIGIAKTGPSSRIVTWKKI